jgi:hypothetical protein
MATLKFRPRAEEISVSLHFCLLVGLAFLIFSNNSSCLFFGLDGSYWAITHDLEAISRKAFSQLGADPVQGSFDAYPGFREHLLPNLLTMPFSDGNPSKATIYTIYLSLMILSVYLLARALHVDAAPALFAGLLYPVLTLPMFIGNLPMIYVIYALVPHATEMTCLTLLTLACFWRLDDQTFYRRALLTLAALFCGVWLVLSSGQVIVLAIPVLLFFGFASLLAPRCWHHNMMRALTAALIFIVLTALGIFSYIYSMYKYTAASFFREEFLDTRSILFFASGIYHESSIGRIITIGGIVGAIYSAVTGQRRIRVFALAYLAYTAIFHAVAFIVTKRLPNYHGPSPLYFEFSLWPLEILFTAIAFFALIDAVALFFMSVADRDRAASSFNAWHGSFLRYSLLGIISLSLLVANAIAVFNRRVSCPNSFSPISPTSITAHLEQAIAFRPGSPFRGLVATFTGYQQKPSTHWFDLHNHDYEIWDKTGNDHRTVGLWRYNIPTLFQYGSLTTPAYYLMLTRFLSRPEDKQMRATIVLTKPEERMLKLWGVRFAIVDFDSDFGTSRIALPVSGQPALRLVELDDFNRGQYSPTRVLDARDFRSALDVMRDPSFDGSREIVTDAKLPQDLQPAKSVELKVEKYGLSIHADSSGNSILVLPAQFSNCWSVHGEEGDPVLFRANIMQLGVGFKGKLAASLVFHYGPILASHCRLEDLRDMERFDLDGARAHTSPTWKMMHSRD